MKRLILLWISKIIRNIDIYAGTGTTVSDLGDGKTKRSLNNRRISHLTKKYQLKPEYCIYEIENICTVKGVSKYKLINTMSDSIIEVDKDVFKEIFKEVPK